MQDDMRAPTEHDPIRCARQRLMRAIVLFVTFAGMFGLAFACGVRGGLKAFRPTEPSILWRGAGITILLVNVLVFAGLAVVLLVPELRKAWLCYRQARKSGIHKRESL